MEPDFILVNSSGIPPKNIPPLITQVPTIIVSITAVEIKNAASSRAQEFPSVTNHTAVCRTDWDWSRNDTQLRTCVWSCASVSLPFLPCSSEPSAKPQSSRPSQTRLAARHFPLAHWNSPGGQRGVGGAGPQGSSSEWSAQSGWPLQRRASFRHGPLQDGEQFSSFASVRILQVC